MPDVASESPRPTGSIHHLEIWVPFLDRAREEWGWLLGELGYEPFQEWPTGCSWKLDGTYVVVEQTDATTATTHRRTDPGVNHIAFHAGTRENVDRIRALGAEHYAAYLLNTDSYEVELVAD
ncbi:VOC family protein [Paenarthrobacter nitroguajacolicus]|uniref:VOC family protein n=1 Tax=Paenarthrobacter nitroguajacolicus TaxID=211146 RepID=UPI003ADA690D